MKLKIDKNKCFLFVIASWLMAKLWWTFEMSRLAVYRNVPQKEVNQVIYASQLPPMSHWSYEYDRFSILNYDEETNVLIIQKLPGLTTN